jgi:hypothetical protein
MNMNRTTSALCVLLAAIAGGCGSSTLITHDDGGGPGVVQPPPAMGGSGGAAGGTGGATGGTGGAMGGTGGTPINCTAGAACTVDCARSCPSGGSVPCTCTNGRYTCGMCRGPQPPGGGGGINRDGGAVAPMACPANAQGTRCDPAQPICIQNAQGGATLAICVCRQTTWTCLGGGGGGGGGPGPVIPRDGGAPDALRVMACPATAQTGAACPTMGTACTFPSDGAVSGCICFGAGGGMLQWRCNR